MNYTTAFGWLHLVSVICMSIYGFVTKKNKLFDKLYIFIVISIPLSWILFKDECIISYLIKKIEKPNYILGTDSGKAEDLIALFKNKNHYFIFDFIVKMLSTFSLFIANDRTAHISYFILLPSLIMYIFYNNFNQLPYFKLILCSLLLTTLYKTIQG
jgi:hypothetical protein